MKISIDTCVLLDLLLDQNKESIEKLSKHMANNNELVICDMVYGEIYSFFNTHKIDIELFLSELNIKVNTCEKKIYAYAGKKWNEYCKKRKIICPSCGKIMNFKCSKCNGIIKFRQHILADFIIGAFSELNCDGLLTRDFGYYKTYFPKLKLL